MSPLIQTITRISPVHLWSTEAFSNLLAPEHLGKPSKIEVCLVTDPRTGMKYRMETTFIFEHKNGAHRERELALKCNQVPGMIPAMNGNLNLVPDHNFYTLSIPKVISSNKPSERVSKGDGIKVYMNTKGLEKKPKRSKQPKKKNRNLVEPLLQYFIENECLICGYIALYESEEISRKHMLSHIRHDDYACDCCRKAFDSASELYKHKIDKTKKKPYVCEVCSKRFKRNHFLSSHIKTDHMAASRSKEKKKERKKNYIEQNFACTICHKRFHNFSSIRDHKRCHAGLEKFKCLLCSKYFFNASILRLHKHVFSADDDYRCKICKKGFTSYRRLEEHKRVHKRKQLFSCEICHEKFYLQTKFIEHNRLVHNIS